MFYLQLFDFFRGKAGDLLNQRKVGPIFLLTQ